MRIKCTRRHFSKVVGGVGLAGIANQGLPKLRGEPLRTDKSALVIWLGGGPPTIDMWDMKPEAEGGGPFEPIQTTGDGQICEHLPQLAKRMGHLAIVRSMNTREEDHGRATYYLKTGHQLDRGVRLPSISAVAARRLVAGRDNLAIPPNVSIGGSRVGAGVLGGEFEPLMVDYDGRIPGYDITADRPKLEQRLKVLSAIASEEKPSRHLQMMQVAARLIDSNQKDAFRVDLEDGSTRRRYGSSNVGKGLLLARRLIEAGVPSIEVSLRGWDLHKGAFAKLQNELLPDFDQALSALLNDLEERGRIKDVTILCYGEFGRSPEVNKLGGRDHWAKAWSALLGGGGIRGGKVVGETSKDGRKVVGKAHSAEDLLATFLAGLGVPHSEKLEISRGRTITLGGTGRPIKDILNT